VLHRTRTPCVICSSSCGNASIDTRTRLLHIGSRGRRTSVISPWTRAYAYACARTNASCMLRRPRMKSLEHRSTSRVKLVRSSNLATTGGTVYFLVVWHFVKEIARASALERNEEAPILKKSDGLNKTLNPLCRIEDCCVKCYFRCFDDFTNLIFAREI